MVAIQVILQRFSYMVVICGQHYHEIASMVIALNMLQDRCYWPPIIKLLWLFDNTAHKFKVLNICSKRLMTSMATKIPVASISSVQGNTPVTLTQWSCCCNRHFLLQRKYNSCNSRKVRCGRRNLLSRAKHCYSMQNLSQWFIIYFSTCSDRIKK